MNQKTFFMALMALLTLLGNAAWAQDGEYIEVRDLETWTSGKLNIKMNKKWHSGLTGQVRMDENSSELKNYFFQGNLDHKLFKGFWLSGGLRYITRNDNEGNTQGFEHYLRYQLDFIYKHDIKRLDFKYRLRYSNRNEIGVSLDDGDTHVQYFRLKAGLDYNIKKWKFDPELSGEIFNRQVNGGFNNGFDAYRITFGTSYKIKGVGKIGLAYRMEREFDSYYPMTTNIIRIKYAYTLKL